MKSTDIIQPTPISAPIAHEGLKFDIPENATGSALASVAEGFPEITMKSLANGGLPPRGQDCNGMFYLSTDQKVYLQNGGIITFNQSVSDLIGGYPQGAYLDYIASDGNYLKVKSLIDDNTYNFVTNPEYIDGEKWELVNFGGANTSLTNLTPAGEAHFVNRSQITNCILETPDRVKYTLENGVLTIKAGTVVLVPYGTQDLTASYPVGSTFLNDNYRVVDTQYTNGKFFVWAEIQNNILLSYPITSTEPTSICINLMQNSYSGSIVAHTYSGNDFGSLYGQYYNTETNIISYIENGAIKDNQTNMSFPIMIVTGNGTQQFGTIKQVFNGRGYFGSIEWIEKGIKGLASVGRNADGSYNNIEFVTDRVYISEFTSPTSIFYLETFYCVQDNTDAELAAGIIFYVLKNMIYNQASEPPKSEYVLWFNPLSGEYKRYVNNAWHHVVICPFNSSYKSGEHILNWQPRRVFAAADEQDIDGQWVALQSTLIKHAVYPTSTDTVIDLSNILPNDGNIYEILLEADTATGATAGNYCGCIVDSGLGFVIMVSSCRTRTNSTMQVDGAATIPLGANKILTVVAVSTYVGTYTLYLKAYRKVR